MAQTSYYSVIKAFGDGRNLIRQAGKCAFVTTGTSVALSTNIKFLKFGKLTPIAPTHTSANTKDLLDFATASISNGRIIGVKRQVSGTSALGFFYELVGY